ncbi:root phototropism protein 2-like isoform X1 [Miscanthus floridulus]|uniref:root phototropism protein 2-like isoform X1 n=2 Tax=Miscanthus floridulus TaxID=154761 RepID=UPI00345975BA
MAASSMDRITGQWVSSQEVAADLTVRIADSVFPLHKAVMVPKCGYIRRAVAAASQPQGTGAGAVELDLSALPGGADAFEKATRYCYGGSLEITEHDAAAVRCAAAFLDAPDLARRADDFLAQTALRSLPGAAAVLRSCEMLLPAAEELGVARRAAVAVALGVCNEALFPTARPGAGATGWWAAELLALSPASFRGVVTALRCLRAGPEVVAAAAVTYAERVLAGILAPAAAPGPGRRDRDAVVRAEAGQRALLEAVVDALPPAADAQLPAAFLCRLLHAAVTAEASAKTCRHMELRVAAVLDQATAGDLLGVALDGAGERVRNADTVRRVVAAFVERQQRQPPQTQEVRRPSLAEGELLSATGPLEKVAKTVDEVAAEMATDESLPISKFVGVAGAVPQDARPSHDCLYRAVDIYLKTHPGLDEIEREKVCSVMDPLRLSYQARLHASQNKRLPLQAVLSALYYDQLKLRSADGGGAEEGGWETQSTAGKARAQARADASLARENEALRSELASMRAYVSGMRQHSKGSGSRSSSSRVPAAAAGKKASFLGSVSRTLSRLNPFKGGWAKDTASIADGRDRSAMHVVKPKRRRFSIG